MSRCREKQTDYLAVLQYQCPLKDRTVKMKSRGNITSHVLAYETGSKRQLVLCTKGLQLHAPSSVITSSYFNSMHLLTERLGKFPPCRSHITLASSRNKPLLAYIIEDKHKTAHHLPARHIVYIYGTYKVQCATDLTCSVYSLEIDTSTRPSNLARQEAVVELVPIMLRTRPCSAYWAWFA